MDDPEDDQRLIELKRRENELATLILSEGTSEDKERESMLLKEMAEVFFERGLLMKDAGLDNFVVAVALVNAALLRTGNPDLTENLEKLLIQTETAFCKALSIPTKHLPSEFTSDVKLRLNQIRQTFANGAVGILETFTANFSFEVTDIERMHSEREFIDQVQSLFTDLTQELAGLFRYIISLSKDMLGCPPQEYAVIALGSLARGESTPYSDIEWGILVEDDTKDTDYFRNLTRTVHMFVLNIQETLLKSLAITSLNDYATLGGNWFVDTTAPRGFQFDSAAPYAGNTPLGRKDRELIRTPKNMAQFCEYETAKRERNNIDRIMATTLMIDGSEAGGPSLYNEFNIARAKFKNETLVKQKAFEEIRELISAYFPKLSFHTSSRTVHDIKQDMFRLPTLIITLFKTLFSIEKDNTWAVLDEMNSKDILTEDASHNLRCLISIVSLLRLITYSKKLQQNELISLFTTGRSPNVYQTNLDLIFRYYYTMVPFVDFMNSLDASQISQISKIKFSFYQRNDKTDALIEFYCCSYQRARSSCFRHIEKLSETLDKETTEKVKKLCYENKEISFQEDNIEALDCVSLIVSSYRCEGNLGKAVEYFKLLQSTIENLRESQHATPYVLTQMGLLCLTLGERDLALGYVQQSLDIQKTEDSDNLQRANDIMLLGWIHYENSASEKALQCMHESLRIKEEALDVREDDPILRKDLIAAVYIRMGEYDKALEYYTDSLNKRKALHLEEDHPDTANILKCIAMLYQDMGKSEKAMLYFKLSLDMRKNLHGENADHTDIDTCLYQIGLLHIDKHELEKALQFLTASLEMCERLHEHKDHCDIAFRLDRIGKIYQDMQVSSDALRYYRQALEMRKRLHTGGVHCDLVASLSNIGGLYHATGEFDRALEYYTGALEMTERLHTHSDYPDVATISFNIGNVYLQTEQLEKALEFHSRSLKVWKALHKNCDHPRTARSLSSIGAVYYAMKRFDLALQFYQDALKMHQSLYDDGDHVIIASDYFNIGKVFTAVKNMEEALKFYVHCLSMRRKIFEGDHPEIAQILDATGLLYYDMDKFDEALHYLLESLSMRNRMYGSGDHPDIASSLNYIGKVYFEMKEFEKTLQYLLRGIDMCKRLYGHCDDPSLATSLEKIGRSYTCTMNVDSALQYLKESVDVRKRLGIQDLRSVKCINIMACIYLVEKHDNDQALVHYMESLHTVRKYVAVGDHIAIAKSLNNVGAVYCVKKPYEKAIDYLQQSLEMKRRVFGSADDASMAATLFNLGLVNKKMRKLDVALKYTKDALEMRLRLFGNVRHPTISKCHRKLCHIYERMGNVELSNNHRRQYQGNARSKRE